MVAKGIQISATGENFPNSKGYVTRLDLQKDIRLRIVARPQQVLPQQVHNI